MVTRQCIIVFSGFLASLGDSRGAAAAPVGIRRKRKAAAVWRAHHRIRHDAIRTRWLVATSRETRVAFQSAGFAVPEDPIGWAVSTVELDGTRFHEPRDLVQVAVRKGTEEHAWVSDAFV